MTARQSLHRLVEELTEADPPRARRLLEALRTSADPVLRALSLAPADDEADDNDGDGGLTEARQEARTGSLAFPRRGQAKARAGMTWRIRWNELAGFRIDGRISNSSALA